MTPAPSKASGKVMNSDIPEDPRECSLQKLKDFLEAKKRESSLDDEDIIRLYREKVSGLQQWPRKSLSSFSSTRWNNHKVCQLTLPQPISCADILPAFVKATRESASQSGLSTKFPDAWNRLRELKERQIFQIIVKPNRSSTPWLVNPNTATLADLATFHTQHHHEVKDADRFIFEKHEIAEPQTDAELRYFLKTMTAKKDTTFIVDLTSDVKVFSDFNMEEVCTLYEISYDRSNPLS